MPEGKWKDVSVRLSVVVPVYGTEKYLRTCLDSLASQTLRETEFILVDDASPDRSSRIMEEYAARDSRFRVVRHERNRGLFASRVTGAEAAQGEYIAFLDSDDYVSVDFYRAAVTLADHGGFDVVMGDTVWVQQDGSCIVRPVHTDAVPSEPLYGEDVRRAFFGQELTCYSWHTIWNKVYRRDLFNRCLPRFRQLEEHIIMTEDIAFSSVLLYEAQSFARHRGDGVFYCMHAASSTNSAYADAKRFFKNYGDIVTVFEFVEQFLKDKQDGDALAHLMKARQWYCRMWTEARHTCAGSGDEKARAEALTERLAPGFDADAPYDNSEIWWFDRYTLPWNDGAEKIKRAIAGLDGYTPETVSFDVFDTLLQRPFRQPDDLYYMMEDRWQKVNRRCLISFAAARAEAETSARVWARGRREDIELYDIYNALRVTCGASEDCADTMRFVERETEIEYCLPRLSGVQLFQLARYLGRRVILISDMYLDKETITAMLHKCGVADWDAFFLSSEENALKWNGALYTCALNALGAAPETVLHIGDNWHNDFIKPREMGMHAMHHPRAMDVMTDKGRTALGQLGLQSVSSFGGNGSLQSALSFRCMQALTADRFFDNGFAPTQRDSSFAGSPALLGYYAVGGHVLAAAQWLIRRCRADGVKRLVFLARDGWLIMQAVKRLLPEDSGLTVDYQPASRRCLLPALTVHPSDFYALPVNTPAYSVGKVVRLLDFCTADKPPEQIRQEVEAAGFSWEQPFPGRYRYLEFIRWYLDHLYDGCRHQRTYNTLREYYEPILTEGTACFDMGYSGRLQAALCQLAGFGVPVYFIHDDEKECPRLERAYEYEASCFYGLKPGMSGAFREFLLSSDEPPCIGFCRTDKGVEPVYGRSEYNAAARFFIRCVQENALRFVSDYTSRFKGTLVEQVKPIPLSMPFESALRYLPEADIDMMTGIRFEDTVFAGRDDLDLAALIRDQSAAANADAADGRWGMVGFIPSETPLMKRTIGFLLFDRGLLKQKAKHRLAKHPRLLKAAQLGWHGLKRVKSLFRRGVR
ncbi:MAG: glycosyltransferase [Clostridia bacterium]|nr:glycosyltransferase [Clostridia bacterium]